LTATPYAIVLLSGGMDSTALLGGMIGIGYRVDALAVDYGQRHHRELRAARNVAAHYGTRFDVADLSGLSRLLTGSALTDQSVPVPEGHYADESMRSTVVPNRNAILIMIAAGVAAARGAQYVATAVHAGDHPVYPDCRPEFLHAADEAAAAGTAGHGDVHVVAPFIAMTKTDIARTGAADGVPFHLTWSCYQGGAVHCGRCGTCTERIEAFERAGLTDPTEYADLRPTTPGPTLNTPPATGSHTDAIAQVAAAGAIIADGGWCAPADAVDRADVVDPSVYTPGPAAGQP
jgi:7-cyano-7-deazaguanine synthase